MPVRIAEIEASTAASPVDAALHRDAFALQMLLPCGELTEGNGEAKMQLTPPMVRRNESARYWRRLVRPSVSEQQQYLAAGNAKGAHPPIVDEALEAKYVLIEVARTVQVGDI
jgi:hypothetical protein